MSIFPSFKKAQVLVIGDLMLDQYWHGDTQRISPEAPVPVVKVQNDEQRAGGAANVALNIAKLNANCVCLGLTGKDLAGRMLEEILNEESIQTHFVKTHNPTIRKLRIICQQQQLIRLDFEESKYDQAFIQELESHFTQSLESTNAVILSDYNKGCLQNTKALIKASREKSIPVLVDPKGTDFERYRGATLLTPNQKEFEAVVGKIESTEDLVEKALGLIHEYDLTALLVTRGADGMSLIQKDGAAPLHIAAHAKEVYDVTGAGDTVIATLAASIGAGEDLAQSVILANMAASLVVSKLGTAFVSHDELQHLVTEQYQQYGVVSQELLKSHIANAQSRGERVVMTNGCFDMLHAGHIMYLQQARQQGDRLVVAVNSDESVKALKGPQRPINGLDQRMMLLAALRDVDWVVPFSEDTPQRLIAEVLPDILVKGGDYQVTDIAGHEEVLAAGGEVKILGFVEGVSTTNTIKKIIETSQDKPSQ
ncbi:MAG: bifunctional D-glycero-beta-D-manno-heptose-7-phosphate kinase/D-glycero-beta-D-manno-heptose 1-phosphate adenylyltransferase HldE [Pseudomonadota bacterium]|nr:bifunctional D-glycero-beta-D-manno-heptose-7-phosphate kinase/D-glycero-beta-D-manno-heptose 1-phosphate adenylyltransferase HldE [Pseudomonadota bacterium]